MRFYQYLPGLLAMGLLLLGLVNFISTSDPIREGFYLALCFIGLAWVGKEAGRSLHK